MYPFDGVHAQCPETIARNGSHISEDPDKETVEQLAAVGDESPAGRVGTGE